MLKRIICALVLAGIVACGPPSHDPELAPYIESFSAEAFKRGVEIDKETDVYFVDDFEEQNRIGVCETSPFFRRIKILRSYWEKASDSAREILMFHELGHCLLGLAHSGTFGSIMFPSIWVAYDYEENKSQYFDELFSPGAARLLHFGHGEDMPHVPDVLCEGAH